MNMREAFKRLLDGEKITRKGWEEYIKYSKGTNTFLVHQLKSEETCRVYKVSFGEEDKISFVYKDSHNISTTLFLMNDNHNELYVSEEDKMELDAMRWRLKRYCCGRTCAIDRCKIRDLKEVCAIAPGEDLEKVSPEEIRRLYNLIKGEE